MARALAIGVAIFTLLASSSVLAGHRHGCHGYYYQAPVYAAPPVYSAPPVYQAPPVVMMQQPQEAPSDFLRYLPLILELTRGRGGSVTGGSGESRGETIVRDSESRSEIAALKRDLESLRKEAGEGFENVGAVLSRQGQEIVKLRQDVEVISDRVGNVENGASLADRLKNLEAKSGTLSDEAMAKLVEKIKAALPPAPAGAQPAGAQPAGAQPAGAQPAGAQPAAKTTPPKK